MSEEKLTPAEAKALKMSEAGHELTPADMKAIAKELTKKLGHQPTPEDWRNHWQNAFNSPASAKFRRHLYEANKKLGKAAGRKWADDGRAIAAVEAVNNYRNDPSDEKFRQMCCAVGEGDEEFDTVDGHDEGYSEGWEEGVSEIFQEWNR